MLLVDVGVLGLTGRQAERVTHECGVTLNRNTIPNDPNGGWYTSGLRLGTAAVSTLGMGALEMREIAAIVALILSNTRPAKNSKANYEIEPQVMKEARARVADLLNQYPLYPELDAAFLAEQFVVGEVERTA
jgi:glycine hydroxymethyltransferase